jgi:cysteine desulfurase
MSIYLDCNATTPVEPEVSKVIRFYTDHEYGNSGSRTHNYGTVAKQAVQKARQQVAMLLPGVDSSDIIFTSGATESNNIAILGLLKWARENGKNHIITTSIEHKAVLEPIAYAESIGFEVDRIFPNESGAIDSSDVLKLIQDNTFLISVMHVNNETGIIQPIDEIANGLPKCGCYFHVDAAQGYGKELDKLSNTRIDLISLSGHKIYGSKGLGALIMRRREFKRAPLTPIMYGGGQERGLRPGTLPVPLIAGLGVAAELCKKNHKQRNLTNAALRKNLFLALEGLNYEINGAESLSLPNSVNLSFPGINSEALMLAFKGVIAISNGSACTSQSYEPSHVLTAMGLPEDRINSSIRVSWCHMTPEPDWAIIKKIILSFS